MGAAAQRLGRPGLACRAGRTGGTGGGLLGHGGQAAMDSVAMVLVAAWLVH